MSEYDYHLASPETLEAMRQRCTEQDHHFVNGCSAMFRAYQFCKWCGEEAR